MINMMLESNKEKIAKLETDLAHSKTGDKRLAALVKSYRERIAESDSETTVLKQQLASLSYTNSELQTGMKNLQDENSKLQTSNSDLQTKIGRASCRER